MKHGLVIWAPPAVLAVVVVGLTCALHWPLPLHLQDHHVLGAFHDGHVWTFDQMWRMLSLQEPWARATRRLAFPGEADVRYIAWVPAVLAVPLRPFLGVLGSYNLVMLLSPALAALAAWRLFLRLFQGGSWAAAGAALAYGLCPFALGSLANGQIAKFSHWVLPLHLLSLLALLTWRRWWLGGLCVAGATLAASFTSPSLTLQVPLAAAGFVLWSIFAMPGSRRARLLRGGLALSLTALFLLPAWRYYGAPPVPNASKVQPGYHLDLRHLPVPSPVAQPEEMLLGPNRVETNPQQCNHLTYLGWPLLAVVLLLSVGRFRGRGLAWGAVVGGGAVSLGPWLAMHDNWVLLEGGRSVLLPAHLLDQVGYPLKDSGMYYRLVLLASLGLAAALAGATAKMRAPWAALLAWTIGLAAVGDGWRVSQPLWPRPVDLVAGLPGLRAMAADPEPGATLDLPLETSTWGNGLHLLSAAVHGRRTTALPAVTRLGDTPHLRRVQEQVERAFATADAAQARQVLAVAGYRYVIWHGELAGPPQMRELARWEELLGRPEGEGSLFYWVTGQTP